MATHESNKRLKTASGAPIKISASKLQAYQPPAAIRAQKRGPASASIARPANGKTSLRLTVKAPPSKLRQATSGSSILPNPYTDAASESDTTPQPAVARAARSTRNPRAVVEHDSDEDEQDEDDVEEDEEEEEEEEEEGDDEDEEMEDVDGGSNANDESAEEAEDDEGEEDEDEGTEDELVLEHPPRPVIHQERVPGKSAPNVTVTAPPEGPLQSVEDKEMEDEEDEELSELDSNENDDEDEEEEEVDDSDDQDEEGMSRSATPDLSKLTRRQRGQYEEIDTGLMALSNEAQKKKHLTAEEHAVRRAEMARRRKNLSEKRNEEEKMDTINKLLKKPAPKRRTRAEILAAQQADSTATPGAEEGDEERPDPLFVRWVNARDGSRLGVPEEWLEAPIGESFVPRGTSRMVEEVA